MEIETQLLRLALALFCGIVLGYDRERKGKPLGMRAFVLVCMGSAGFCLIAVQFAEIGLASGSSVGVDPTRAIQGIVSGIGFIGAGAIIQSQGNTKGAATGASIWVVGAVGVACGYGMYSIALILTAFSFLTLTALEWCSKRVHDKIE